MFILARGGQTYARLRFNVGPTADVEIVTEIDYERPFDGCDREAWEIEYFANVNSLEPEFGSAELSDRAFGENGGNWFTKCSIDQQDGRLLVDEDEAKEEQLW